MRSAAQSAQETPNQLAQSIMSVLKHLLAGKRGSDLDCGVAEDHVEQPDVICGVVLGYGISSGVFGIGKSSK